MTPPPPRHGLCGTGRHHGSAAERGVSTPPTPPRGPPRVADPGCVVSPSRPPPVTAPRPQGGPEAAVRALAGERRQQRELPGAALDRPGPQQIPRPLEAQRQEGRHQRRPGGLQGGGGGAGVTGGSFASSGRGGLEGTRSSLGVFVTVGGMGATRSELEVFRVGGMWELGTGGESRHP